MKGQQLAERIFEESSVHERVLPNGITAIVREDHSAPVVAIVTYLKVGYFDEPDELAGISHVLEHMFFKGTPTRGPGEIAQATKAAGGYLNASTTYDHTSYYTVLPADSLEQGLQIQSDALLNSVIDADELRRELQVIIQEAKRKLDNPDAIAAEGLYELMFDRHRMRRWRIGTEAFLQSLTREQLWQFYRMMYRGDATIVVVAGDVDPDDTHTQIGKYYGALAARDGGREPGPREPAHRNFRLREKTGDIIQARMSIGWHSAPALHDDTAALDLLATVLGQGRASRLYRNVREAGLVTHVGARNYTPTEVGVFAIDAELKSEHSAAAAAAIAASVAGVREQIGAAEVERARSILESRALRRLESMEGQANYIAEWQALGDWRIGDEFLQRVREASAEQLRDAARRYLDPAAASVFLYEPQAGGNTRWTQEELKQRFVEVKPAGAPRFEAPREIAAPNIRPLKAQIDRAVHRYTTSSGLQIVVEQRTSVPLVSLALAAAGGSNLESAEHAGFTSLVARTSVKGTTQRNAIQLALETEALGSTIAPSVLPDLFNWYTTVPSRHFARAVDLLADVALHPAIEEAELERERVIALADVDQLRDDMMRYPLKLFMEAAFPDHPYGASIETTIAGLTNARASVLREWHKRCVTAGTPTVLVVGDVDPDEAAQRIDALFEIEVSGATRSPVAVWPAEAKLVEAAREKAQTALVLGYPGPDRSHPDQYVLQVLSNTIAGLGGRLFEELRSKRSLAYTVMAYPVARQLGGAFVSYIATSPEREAEAVQGLIDELGRLRDELLPAEEVERAKRYLIGTWQIRSQPNGARLSDLMSALLIGEGLDELSEYEERIRAVTREQIREAAQSYFDDTRRVQAVVRGTGAAR